MEWVRGENLGHGSFATVNLAVAKRRSNLLPPLMAVKSCAASLSSSMAAERMILEELKDCPQIIRCFGDNYSYERGEKLYNVLLEYAAGGSLADKIKSSGDGRLPEFEARRYTIALLNGIHYIHKAGYVHCDIKLQNILLCADGGVKIADFGLAKRAGGVVAACGELRGTPMYMSPEMVCGGEQEAAADIWAAGCVLTEMISGSPVWRGSDIPSLLMRIGGGVEAPEIPVNLSEEGKDFLGKCFIKDPKERWTAAMLLDHPFVQDCETVDEITATSCSPSPRCPFDFPEWACPITSLPSPDEFLNPNSWFSEGFDFGTGSGSAAPSERMQGLFGQESPDWTDSNGWISIRYFCNY